MIDGTDICKGVKEPNFTPFTLDVPYTISFPSTTPSSNAAPYGTLLLYSNEDQLVNFYLQGVSDATEAVVNNYNLYSDGYAMQISYNFPVSTTGINEYNGMCISSQLHGQSCFAFKPRSGTTQTNAQFFIDDIKSYWNPASTVALTKRIETMEVQKSPSASECVLRGFNKSWRCTKGGFNSSSDSTALISQNGYYNVQCNRFLPMESEKVGKGQTVTDYRFSPYSVTNKYYSPLTVWMYSTNGNDGTTKPYYTQVALTNLKGATNMAVTLASVIAIATLF